MKSLLGRGRCFTQGAALENVIKTVSSLKCSTLTEACCNTFCSKLTLLESLDASARLPEGSEESSITTAALCNCH